MSLWTLDAWAGSCPRTWLLESSSEECGRPGVTRSSLKHAQAGPSCHALPTSVAGSQSAVRRNGHGCRQTAPCGRTPVVAKPSLPGREEGLLSMTPVSGISARPVPSHQTGKRFRWVITGCSISTCRRGNRVPLACPPELSGKGFPLPVPAHQDQAGGGLRAPLLPLSAAPSCRRDYLRDSHRSARRVPSSVPLSLPISRLPIDRPTTPRSPHAAERAPDRAKRNPLARPCG